MFRWASQCGERTITRSSPGTEFQPRLGAARTNSLPQPEETKGPGIRAICHYFVSFNQQLATGKRQSYWFTVRAALCSAITCLA
jgi:hypothetical protein